MIIWLNLFLVPMISICFYYSRRKEKLNFSLLFVIRYAIMTVSVFLITRFIFKFLKLFFSFTLEMGGVLYTLGAVCVALVLPFVVEFIQKYISVKVKVATHEE